MEEGLAILRKLPESIVVEEWECLKGGKATELEKGILNLARKYCTTEDDWNILRGALEENWKEEEQGGMIFKNDNGYDFFIIAGDDKCALMRNMETGGYVIARGLRWDDKCWTGGDYFSKDEFEIAVRVFMEMK